MIRRHSSTVIAFVAFLVGLAVIGGTVPVRAPVAVVLIAGAFVFIGAVWSLTWRRTSRALFEPPIPEIRERVPVPGTGLEDAVQQFRSWSPGYTTSTRRTYEGLFGAANAVLTRFRGLSDEDARRQIESGEWTDDDVAATFLTGSTPTVAPADSQSGRLQSVVAAIPEHRLRDTLAGAVGGESAYRLGIRRTAAAIAAIGYGTDRDGGNSTREADRTAGVDQVPQVDIGEMDAVEIRTTQDRIDGVVEGEVFKTGYWSGFGFVALLAITVGLYAQSAGLLLAGAIAIGYAGVAAVTRARTPTLRIERTLDEQRAEPGDDVEVTVTITNESGRMLPDVRIVDGVPAGLPVSDGSPRLGTALRDGESVTYSYSVTAQPGPHAFDPALVITRSLGQAEERTCYVGAETVLVCKPRLRPLSTPVPLRASTGGIGGTIETQSAGPGSAFHSIREYRPGDPLNRIDWHRHARTRELATVEFHEEHVARVLLVVDARREAFFASSPSRVHAVDRSLIAAGRIAASLLDDGHSVGLAAIGPVDGRADAGDECWLRPGAGTDHRERLQRLLGSHPQLSSAPPAVDTRFTPQVRSIAGRLKSGTQAVLFTPLCDANAVEIARLLEAYGHPVTVISPDPTAERTTGQQLTRVARRIRRFDLQRKGIPVIDWPDGEPIDAAIARGHAGDRR